MTPRLIVFTDTDENTLLAHLEADRVQLSAIDSRPALAGYELKRFIAELAHTYTAAPLIARVDEAAAALARARGALAGARTPKARAARAALDEAHHAIAAVRGELTRPPPEERDVAAGAARRRTRRHPNRVRDSGRLGPRWQAPRWLPAELTAMLAYRRDDRDPALTGCA